MKKILFGISILLIFSTAARAHDAAYFYALGMDSSMTSRKILYFTKALELNPGFSAAYEKRGRLYGFQEKYTRMRDDFLKVTELKPSHSEGYAMLGFADMKKGDYDNAISNLTRAIELGPPTAEAFGYRAETYRLKGMADAAVQDANKVIEIGGSKQTIGMAYSTRAKAYRDLGLARQADADFEKAVTLDPAYDIYKFFTITEFLADSAGKSGSLKGISRMGGALIVAILLVLIFKLTISPPEKRK